MDDDSTLDDIEICVFGSNCNHTSGQSSAWVDASILNKPIGDFHTKTFNKENNSPDNPRFAVNSGNAVQIRVNSDFIPEPKE